MMEETQIRAKLPALAAGGVAVITGGASGIGLAAATRFAQLGLIPILADRSGPALEAAAAGIPGAIAAPTDVSDAAQMQALAARAAAAGPIAIVMNNAGIGANPGRSWENGDAWRALLEVNLWGVINGVQAFAPGLIARAQPALIINTGSKQGITLPPGNSAYNLSKAGVRAYTETLAHELRSVAGGAVSAHLLIPGFTHTGMTGAAEKPKAAWSGAQVIEFMLESLARRDFYILCPDNDVTREMDEKRMRWMADDIIENRPALSRWHRDHADAFARFMTPG